MPELEPITREEKFLNGEVGMTPITREEKILAGEDVETITRREYFLKKYRGGGGGDITVEEITITENGTTTAPSGKAYSPIHTNVPQPTLSTLEVSENGDYDAPSGTAYNRVEVDVPLPENAYLLKSVANLPQAIATFTDGADAPMKSLKVAIEPQQDLHGYDSPWAGGAGKNKFDEANPDKWVFADGNLTDDEGSMTSQLIDVTAGQTWTLSSANNTSTLCICFYDSSMNLLNRTAQARVGQISATAPLNSAYMYGSSFKSHNKLQLEIGSSATSYAPYSNICPISGWDEADVTRTGKNLFDKTQTFTKDRYIDINGNIQITTYGWEISDYIPLKNNANYYISGNNVTGASACNALYDKDKNLVRAFNYPTGEHNGTFSTNANEFYIRICTQESVVDNVQIEIGDTATTYEAYNGHTYTIDLDGTRYGGELDVVSGVLTVTQKNELFVGSVAEGWFDATSGGVLRFATIRNDMKQSSSRMELLNNIAKFSTANENNICFGVTLGGNSIIYYYPDNTVTSLNELYTFLSNNNMQVVYPLQTPQTYQLTPTEVKTLLGLNNIWADTGDITDAEYFSKEV